MEIWFPKNNTNLLKKKTMKNTKYHTKKIWFISLIILFLLNLNLAAQNGKISGTVMDAKTGESIVGANVIIKGKNMGASTDFDGKYEISNLVPGVYQLEVSYISYNIELINNVNVQANKTTTLNITLKEKSISLQEVKITAEKKTETEISVASTIKASSVVASGISAQQISRTQDRDASEVVKRIPGVTIIDNRFIIVRGLNERYNVVWLNNVMTPSSESDRRAFSFDVIPSSMLDRVIIYKTPSPELPGDFAGGAIHIFSKNSFEKNFLNVSFSGSLHSNTTGKTFFETKQSSTDFLGFDNGYRALLSEFPDYTEMIKLSNSNSQSDKDFITKLGREMNKDWTAMESTAKPDIRFSLAAGYKWERKKLKFGTITSLNYSNTYTFQKVFRADYEDYDTIHDKSDTSYYFNDNQYFHKVKLSVMNNWFFKLSDKSKIEFRNLLNQNGTNKTTFRNGRDNYGGSTIRAYEYYYQSRTTYSGQLSGDHSLREDVSKLNWVLGYSYANKKEPDVKRLTMIKSEEDPDDPHYGQYATQIPFAATPEMTGRLYIDMNENIINAGSNYERKLKFKAFKPEIKAGFYLELKSRSFNARNIGYRIAKTSGFDWNLIYLSIDSLFLDTNINSTTGIKIDEKTNASDSYNAENKLFAAYLSLKIPIKSRLNFYTGLRMEKNIQSLNSFQIDNPNIPVNVDNDTINFFPSASLTYDLSEKSLLRVAYGMTVNRPEFREIAPMLFYDFELKAGIRGNTDLKNCYIHNYDVRYEFYPSLAESFLVGAFYKKFINPIESTVIPAGSGIDYSFTNADKASNWGFELEFRKNFRNLQKSTNMLKYLKDFSIVANGTYIHSKVEFADNRLEHDRPMQGQSPYIINTGLFYQNDSIGFNFSILYNIIGERIVTAGNPFQNTPDIYELSRNLLDLTISQKIGKHLQIKAGIQDVLNNKVILRQKITFMQDTNKDGIGDTEVVRNQDMKSFIPGSYYTLGVIFIW